MTKNAKVPVEPLFDNSIDEDDEEHFIREIDEYMFASADTMCKRLDISDSTWRRVLREYGEKLDTYVLLGTTTVRYRIKDVVRLLRKRQ